MWKSSNSLSDYWWYKMTLFPSKKLLLKIIREVTSKHVGGFYRLNCLHSYGTKNKLKKHYNVCKNHDHCYVEMPKKKII